MRLSRADASGGASELKRLLEEPSFTEAAQAVAARHAGDDPAARVTRIVDRFEELIAPTQAG